MLNQTNWLMKNKFLIPSLSFFFIIVIIKYLFTLYLWAIECDGWIIGDWLINFQAGFVRRGLSGSLILNLSDFLKLKPNFTVMWIQMTIYIAYMFILFFLIYRKKINMWFLILLLSPVTLLFPILDPSNAVTGRKEIILFLLFALYVLCLNRKMLKSPFVIFLFSIALLVATLFHELVFFYTPYFILAAYLKSKIDNEPFYFSKILFVILGSFLVMIPLYLFGRTINGSIICSGLMEKGLSGNICNGVLSIPVGIKDVFKCAKENEYFSNYSIAFFLGLVPFVLYIKFSKHQVVTLRKFFVAFFFLFLFSSPLFILAVDWGRWINIHFMLLLFTSTLLLKDKSCESKVSWSKEYLAIPRLWKSETTLSKLSNNMVFFLISFSYVTLWCMSCSSAFSIFSLKFYSKLIKFIGLFIDLIY